MHLMSKSEEIDLKIIKFVEKHEFLYNTSSINNIPALKKHTWDNIGEQMNLPGFECKRRWDRLIKYYRKLLPHQNTWIFKKHLRFLDTFIFLQRQLQNVQITDVQIVTPWKDETKASAVTALQASDTETDGTSSKHPKQNKENGCGKKVSAVTSSHKPIEKQNEDNYQIVNSKKCINFGIHYGNENINLQSSPSKKQKLDNEFQCRTIIGNNIKEKINDSSEEYQLSPVSSLSPPKKLNPDISEYEEFDKLLTSALSAVKELHEQPPDSTRILFRSMANKIIDASLKREQVIAIEHEVCKMVYSKLAIFLAQRNLKSEPS